MQLPESAINGALASVLTRMNQNWSVTAEPAGVIKDCAGSRVDILVEQFKNSRLVLQNELAPARTVEEVAVERLGKRFASDGSVISGAVALRTPASLNMCRTVEEAQDKLSTLELEYALFRLIPNSVGDSPTNVNRTPATPHKFLKGPIPALAEFLLNAGTGDFLFHESLQALDEGVEEAIEVLKAMTQTSDQLKSKLANILMQSFSDEGISQGLGIAATVVINATLFQQTLAVQYDNVMSLAQMRARGMLHQTGVINQGRKILEINYWPIYSIAVSVLEAIDEPYVASEFVQRLSATTQKLIDLEVATTHDLCGIVFQRFMTERKYLASFYTRPESARLLAHLAVPDLDWASPSVYSGFKFADYACGTGALVHGVYQRVSHLYEFAGGNPSSVHAHMMENNVTAADIVPSAAHLTATLLTSLFPHKTYRTSRVEVPDYGRIGDEDRVCLGSLELLAEEQEYFSTLFPNPSDGKVIGPEGEAELSYQLTAIPKSQDLVIMNPPYTRSMSDWIDGAHGTWKPFNALGNSEETQALMRSRERELTANVDCYNGYQSMPSAFCGVADRMLKEEGTFAFVLPMTSLQGCSWHKFRTMLAQNYLNVVAVSIAKRKAIDCSWSADTDLAEVLIVGRKNGSNDQNSDRKPRGTLVTLGERPPNSMMATEYAQAIKSAVGARSHLTRTLEDGPFGGTPLTVGDEVIGELLSVPMSDVSWNELGIRDLSLAQFVHQLSKGTLWFPGSRRPISDEIAIERIESFATVGYADNNIANNTRAAYQRIPVSQNPDFPMVWKKESSKQRSLVVDPDQEGRIKTEREDLAFRIWDRRSCSLIAREVSFPSQSLVTAYASTSVIGGRAWPNVQLKSPAHEKAFVLWGNSTLGLISFWYYSSRQQVTRGMVTVTDIAELPWFDPTSLSSDQLAEVEELFQDLQERKFKAVGAADEDDARIELDQRLLVDILRLPKAILEPLARLRSKWCSEPSVAPN